MTKTSINIAKILYSAFGYVIRQLLYKTKMNHYVEVLKKYAVFSGRASRAEYWYFVLINFVVSFLIGFISRLVGLADSSGQSILSNIYSLAVLVPSIAVGVRRLHDVGKSGWFLLIPFYNLYLLIIAGTAGDNKYGAPVAK